MLVNGLAGITELQEASDSYESDGNLVEVNEIEEAPEEGDEIPMMASDDDEATEIVQVATNTPSEATIVEDLTCPEYAVTEITEIPDWPARMRQANYT